MAGRLNMGKYTAAVDCRTDNTSECNFLELNLWGRPLFTYAVNAVLNCPDIDETIVVTDNNKIKDIASGINGVTVSEEMPRQTEVIVVSGLCGFFKVTDIEHGLKYIQGRSYGVGSRKTCDKYGFFMYYDAWKDGTGTGQCILY